VLERGAPRPEGGQGGGRGGGEDGGEGEEAPPLYQPGEAEALVGLQGAPETQVSHGIEEDENHPPHSGGQVGPEVVGKGRRRPRQFGAQQSGDGGRQVSDGQALVVGHHEFVGGELPCQGWKTMATDDLFNLVRRAHYLLR